MPKPQLPPDSPVCSTVYSVVWPHTEAFVRTMLTQHAEELLDMHRDAHTKRQDGMHDAFFDAWLDFSRSAVKFAPDQLAERYPTAGSSEAIREIIRQACWKGQDMVVFDGEYEGYEAIASVQHTRIHRVDRATWKETLQHWQRVGPPWGERDVQWWVSQPSAIDGNVWPEFSEWLSALECWAGRCEVWVDLTYVGRSRMGAPIDLSGSSVVAGVVFSLSKVMGAYYRRVGGCLSRNAVEGLWANRWFKNLDSLYLGQRWLQQARDARVEGAKYAVEQARAMEIALDQLGGASWKQINVHWRASDVALLMHAAHPEQSVPGSLAVAWDAGARGTDRIVSRRLCLAPTLVKLLSGGIV